ncbi:MAG: 2-C-methyl-D-erythritol 4-phosphate cytidylyltransferase [Candidatus Eremiobacteraeota bacterium]|nr:2-C-methyl-D-erythritol 4-phosphate cytidylyltransferase [Candidatus Eremiobacteraeota bacterium]
MNNSPSWGAILVAAGRGTRLGRPKQLLEIAGKPMLAWSLETFVAMAEIDAIVVAVEPDIMEATRELAKQIGRGRACEIAVVTGGATRQHSVRSGLDALPGRCTHVLVHDGARPNVRAEHVRRGMAVVAPGVGALLATPVVDTVKQLDAAGKVVRTLDRTWLWTAQTPQFATVADLRRAHREAERRAIEATDDATLLERAGFDVIAVEGDPENFKVTVASDLRRAEAVLAPITG